MLYAAFTQGGQEYSELFFSWELFHGRTFNPETELHCLIDFTVSGQSYGARKESVRRTAQAFQREERPGLSYGDLVNIGIWFERAAKKYGLLREFRENGIL